MTLTPEQKDIIDKYVKKPEWRVAGKRADFNAIGERFGVSPVVARVITNRGVTGEKAIAMYLDGDWDSMHDPALMKDMVEAGEIIKEKLSDNRRIRIISDYDVDGVTSNYILLLGLRRTWAALHGSCADDCTVVDYDIPHRVHDGYGINKRLIDAAIADGVDTIITCDNGIAAIEQVRYAKERGLTVIVTDHHQIPFEESDGGERVYMLPQADAVIDNQSAVKQYSVIDAFSVIFALLMASIPAFWLGMLLMLLFSLNLGWLPSSGYEGVKWLILPSITLGFINCATIMRMTRSSMLEVVRQDFIRTARAKGATEKRVVFRHALKNAIIPVITVVGTAFGSSLGGAVVTETVFGLPGMGTQIITAIRQKDNPVVLASVIVIALAFSLVNLIVDILYTYVDPRIRD